MATVAKGKRPTKRELRDVRTLRDVTPAEMKRLGLRSAEEIRAGLKPARPEATLEGPRSSKGGKVGRDRAKPDTSTYEGRFAARLGDLTKAAGFEPPALAERLGVSEQVVYDWLAGRKMPAVGRFPVLAKLFKLKHPGDILPPK